MIKGVFGRGSAVPQFETRPCVFSGFLVKGKLSHLADVLFYSEFMLSINCEYLFCSIAMPGMPGTAGLFKRDKSPSVKRKDEGIHYISFYFLSSRTKEIMVVSILP